jgi:maltose O-acetyltransferase
MSLLKRIKQSIRGEISTETLKKRGLAVGERFYRGSGVYIDPEYCWLIRIGDDVGLAPFVRIFAHDEIARNMFGYTRAAPVVIGDVVKIATHVTILPGVTIGDHVGIIAGSVVTCDIPPNTVVGGNPARKIAVFDRYLEDLGGQIAAAPVFGEEWTIRGGITPRMKREMLRVLSEEGSGYVR